MKLAARSVAAGSVGGRLEIHRKEADGTIRKLHGGYFSQILDDFKKRIDHYQERYQTLDESYESDYSFMKIFDCGTKVMVHKHEGHIQSR